MAADPPHIFLNSFGTVQGITWGSESFRLELSYLFGHIDCMELTETSSTTEIDLYFSELKTIYEDGSEYIERRNSRKHRTADGYFVGEYVSKGHVDDNGVITHIHHFYSRKDMKVHDIHGISDTQKLMLKLKYAEPWLPPQRMFYTSYGESSEFLLNYDDGKPLLHMMLKGRKFDGQLKMYDRSGNCVKNAVLKGTTVIHHDVSKYGYIRKKLSSIFYGVKWLPGEQ